MLQKPFYCCQLFVFYTPCLSANQILKNENPLFIYNTYTAPRYLIVKTERHCLAMVWGFMTDTRVCSWGPCFDKMLHKPFHWCQLSVFYTPCFSTNYTWKELITKMGIHHLHIPFNCQNWNTLFGYGPWQTPKFVLGVQKTRFHLQQIRMCRLFPTLPHSLRWLFLSQEVPMMIESHLKHVHIRVSVEWMLLLLLTRAEPLFLTFRYHALLAFFTIQLFLRVFATKCIAKRWLYMRPLWLTLKGLHLFFFVLWGRWMLRSPLGINACSVVWVEM